MIADLILTMACMIVAPSAQNEIGQTSQDYQADRPAKLLEIRKVNDLLGSAIEGTGEENLANVEDVLFSTEGRLEYIVAERGGIVGVNADYVAIPRDAFIATQRDGSMVVRLTMTKEQFAKAPVLNRDNYRDLANASFHERNHEFFSTKADEKPHSELIRAKVLIGTRIRNDSDVELGQVDDLLIENNQIAFVIAGQGGVLGLGQDHLAVPVAVVNMETANDGSKALVQVNVTDSQFESAPMLKGDDYSRLKDQAFVETIYSHFGMKNDGND